jgi:hypothetical protein
MSDPVSELRWPHSEPYGLVYEEDAFLRLLGARGAEHEAEHKAAVVAIAASEAEPAAALALT